MDICDLKDLKLGSLAIMGGSFNPVHNDHLLMAELALSALDCDLVLFMPNGAPPHKDTCQISYEMRREMLQLAIAKLANLGILDSERNPFVPHYTYETLKLLRNALGYECAIYFIMGLDSLQYLDEWHRGLELTDLANLLVISRAGYEEKKLKPQLADYVQRHLVERPAKSSSGEIIMQKNSLHEISSSKIRQELQNLTVEQRQLLLRQLESSSDDKLQTPVKSELLSMLKPAVLKYILQHNLYEIIA